LLPPRFWVLLVAVAEFSFRRWFGVNCPRLSAAAVVLPFFRRRRFGAFLGIQ